MKKFKKAMALSLALAMGLSLVACGDKKEETTTEATTTEATTTEAAATDDATADDASASNAEVALPMPAEDSDPIYVYSWNTELGDRLQYVKDKYPQYADLIQYENLGLGGTSDEYKSAIENAIANGGDKVPSIIACDDDVALYFLNSESIVPVEDLGITADMYSNAYQYTVDYATIDGKLKGMCWQATPGCFIYRTDIAEEVLGTSEPEKVQEYVKDWDTFLDTAEKMKQAGYKMLSGPSDTKKPIIDQLTSTQLSQSILSSLRSFTMASTQTTTLSGQMAGIQTLQIRYLVTSDVHGLFTGQSTTRKALRHTEREICVRVLQHITGAVHTLV